MEGKDLLKPVAFGALAGMAGALAIQAARRMNEKAASRRPSSESRTLLPELPKPVESVGAGLLSYLGGPSAAGLYTALRSDREVFVDGAALGAVVWAAGRVGWLPGPQAAGKSPAVTSLLRHVLFGVATVGAYRKLREPSEA